MYYPKTLLERIVWVYFAENFKKKIYKRRKHRMDLKSKINTSGIKRMWALHHTSK